MYLVRLFWRLVRTLILVGAILATLILIVNGLGLIFSYLSWLGSTPSVGIFLAAAIMGGTTFAIVRSILRRRARRTKEYPDSVQILLSRQRKVFIPLSVWCAIGAVAIGYVGSLIPGITRLAVQSLELGGRRAVPILLHLADKGGKETRTAAVRGMMHLGPDAVDAVPWLVQQVNGTRMIQSIGTPGLFKAIGPAAAPPLIDAAIDTNDPARKKELLEDIIWNIPDGKASFEQVMRALNSKDPKQTELGMSLLGRCELAPSDAKPLIEWMEDYGTLRKEAVKALVPVAPACASHLNTLMKLYRASDQCAFVPELFAGIGAPTVQPIIQEMRSRFANQAKFNDLVDALGRIGPPASGARDELRKASESAHYAHRFDADIALAKIDDEVGGVLITLLNAAFKGATYSEQSAGVSGLVSLMPESARAVPRYIEMIEKGTESQQRTAFVLIGRLGKDGAPAVDAICNYLEGDSYPNNRDIALGALQAIGKDAAPAEATLRRIWPRLPMKRKFDAVITQREITGNTDLLSILILQNSKEELRETSFRIEDELKRRVDTLGPEAKILMPAIDKAHADGHLRDYQYQDLVRKIDPWAARLNDPDFWGVVVFGTLLLCLLVETFIFRWHKGWWRREDRKSTLPEYNPFESDSKA